MLEDLILVVKCGHVMWKKSCTMGLVNEQFANWKITMFLKVNQRTKWQFPISYASHYESVNDDNFVISSASTVAITMSDQWI
jgi:hypothetical protein